MNPNELKLLAAICRQYGTRVTDGVPSECGWVISIPNEVIANMPPHGTITQLAQTPQGPFRLRYDVNATIDAGNVIVPGKPPSPVSEWIASAWVDEVTVSVSQKEESGS